MKALKNIIKVLQIVCLLLPFFMILYWIFIVTAFVPGIALLQIVFDPYISFVRTFSNASTAVNGKTIDMVPVVAAFSILIYYMFFLIVYKITDVVDKAIENTQKTYVKQRDKIYQSKMKSNYANELKKFDLSILTMEFQIRRTNAFYMVDPEAINLKAEETKNFIKGLAASVKDFGGIIKSGTNSEAKSNYIFTFNDLENAFKFSTHVRDSLKSKEKEFVDSGGKVIFKGVVHCCEDNKYATEAHYNEKILKVTNDNEICTTEIVDNKFKMLHRKGSVTLYPKGSYQLGGKTFEIFQVNFSY